MTIQEKINNDIKEAMKIKNIDALAALRAAKSAIMLEATKDSATIVADADALKLIARLVKQRKDSATIFIEQDRKDLADDEMRQLVYLEKYLPAQMAPEDVRKIVKKVVSELNASSPSDIGKCMGVLMVRLNGKADGSLISSILREELS